MKRIALMLALFLGLGVLAGNASAGERCYRPCHQTCWRPAPRPCYDPCYQPYYQPCHRPHYRPCR
jgi:hypothetical protein